MNSYPEQHDHPPVPADGMPMQAELTPSEQARFLALVEPIRSTLIAYSRQVVWFPSDCEDVLQTAMVTAFAAFPRYQEGTNFRAWMFKHLQNSAWNHNRRRRNLSLSNPVIESEATAPPMTR